MSLLSKGLPGFDCVGGLNYTNIWALTGVAWLCVDRDHHFAPCPPPGSQGALQRGDAAGCLVAVTSYISEAFKTRNNIYAV